MGLRLRSIRQKILLLVLVPVISLVGLYIFTTVITARDAVNLARTDTLKNATGLPVGVFLTTLDGERPLALVYLSRPTAENLAALVAAEDRTNGAIAVMRTALKSAGTMGNASTPEKQAIATLAGRVQTLPGVRTQIRTQAITRSQAFDDYNTLVQDGYQVLNEVIRQENSATVVANGEAFVRMAKSQEMLLRESALVTADLAAGNYPASDRVAITELIGARKQLVAQTLPDFDPQYRAFYIRDVSPQATAALSAMETRLVSTTVTSRPPPVPAGEWGRTVGAVAGGLTKAGTAASNQATVNFQDEAHSTYLTLALAGGLGLLAVLISILVSVWTGRSLIRELARLRQAALEMAHERLPNVVHRLAAGQQVDVDAEAPELPPAETEEIGQVGEAFAAVQRTAVEAAVGQARLRQGISDIFRNLARRSQSLLHRQLTLLDAMERRAREPEELEDLFRIDHLTTRMRRHAESLIILSGDAPARGWRRPVPFVDVLRAAVAEVEDYTRIKVTATTKAAIAGPAVADVIHLIAELAENAVVFSPPNTPVLITGDIVGRGFAVEIEDRGLGLSEERRAELNELLENPPPFDLSGSDQLGLFVASQLAKKHGIRISLRSSPYGGTTAIVLIPVTLVVGEDSNGESGPEPDTAPVQLTGRHAAREDTGSFAGALGGLAAVPDSYPSPGSTATSPDIYADAPGRFAAVPDGFTEVPDGFTEAPDGLTEAPGGFSRALDDPAGFADTTSPPAAEPAASSATRWPADSAADVWAGASTSTASPAGPAAGGGWADTVPSAPWAAAPSPEVPESANRLNGFPAYPGGGGWTRPADAAGNGDPGDPDLVDEDADPDEAELPRRVRQASLAPQLREPAGPAQPAPEPEAAEAAGDRSPEQARSTVAAIQRGSERGRSLFEAPAKGSTTTVASTEPAGEAGEEETDAGAQHNDE
jgi:signal transduction histidine kinase